MADRCPECGTPNPPPEKVCGNVACCKTFRRSEGGRADAKYCSRACAQAQAARDYRWRGLAAEAGLPAREVARIVYESQISPVVGDDPDAVLAEATRRLSLLAETGQAEAARIRQRLARQISIAAGMRHDAGQLALRRAVTQVVTKIMTLAAHDHASVMNSWLLESAGRLVAAQDPRNPQQLAPAVRAVLDAADGIRADERPVFGTMSRWEREAWDAVEELRACEERGRVSVEPADRRFREYAGARDR
jgi:hypothetical protein